MRIDTHKLIQESYEVNEQDIHIHVGGSSSSQSGTSSTSSSDQSSSQGSQQTQQTQQTQQKTSDQSGSNPAQMLKKQLQGSQQSQQTQHSLTGQPVQHPAVQQTSVHPVQHQNNVQHVGQMMQRHRTATGGQQKGPVKLTKPRFNEATKREMKEIYVRDHIRRIGRRPTSQDVERKFTGI